MEKRYRLSDVWISIPAEALPITDTLSELPMAQPSFGKPTHAPDFSSICQDGEVFTFSGKQRIIVGILWKAREDKHRWVGGDYLLQEAESEGSKVSLIFRNHPAWGKLILHGVICGGSPGTYALAEPMAA